jgi:[protein-PII] uridylyltransferase
MNFSNLNIKIEDLLSQNADDFLIAKEIKAEIKNYLNNLDNTFTSNKGKAFFIKHTKTIDMFIKVIYKYLLRKHYKEFVPLSNNIPLTLFALGSYGREQLCVYSDIDIMLLYKDIAGYNLKPIMEEFISIAWDSGLKLGSRVHEINEIEDIVKTDITIKTAIIESRFIYGSNILAIQFNNKLKNIRNYKQKEFILEKLEEHKQRLINYPLSMNPNIKDGYGGMRETNMLFWLANISYGVSNTKYLAGKHFTDLEYKSYRIALEYIFEVRSALHLISKKENDVINFDLLPDLATKLGFVHTSRYTKERQCMAKLFNALHIIHNFSANIIKKLSRKYLFNSNNIKILRYSRLKKNLYLCENKIFTSYNRKSITLLEFLKEINILPNTVNKFDNSYIYFAKNTIFPESINNNTKVQIKQLLEKKNLYPIIKLFYNANMFTQIFPFAKQIINQPQFDGYHIHPTDMHSIYALKHLQNIKDEFVLDIYNKLSIQSKKLLNILVLFHDVGKGRNKDHSEVGVIIFKNASKSIGIEKSDITLGVRVIQHHNDMSKIAMTQDIYSQKVILNFTSMIQNKDALDLLLCLTYADINSVARKTYNNTNSYLIRELYKNTLISFDNKELLKISTRRHKKELAIKKHLNFKNLTKTMQKNILNIHSNQLFLIYKAQDIIDISISAQDITSIDYKIFNEDRLSIKIIKKIQFNLGYLLSKLSFLNITSLHIFKLYDDKKYFNIVFDECLEDTDLLFLDEIITNSFDMKKEPKYIKPIIYKNNLKIDLNHSEELIQIQINARDQKGLFAYIAYILDKFNIDIISAKINTTNNKINDLLLINNNDNFVLNQEEIIALIITKKQYNTF